MKSLMQLDFARGEKTASAWLISKVGKKSKNFPPSHSSRVAEKRESNKIGCARKKIVLLTNIADDVFFHIDGNRRW